MTFRTHLVTNNGFVLKYSCISVSILAVSLLITGCDKKTENQPATNVASTSASVTTQTNIVTTASSGEVTNLVPASSTVATASSPATSINPNSPSHTQASNLPNKTVSELRPDVSQQFMGTDDTSIRLAYALPEIPYSTQDLSSYAQQVNQAQWQADKTLDKPTITKIQALLNWHNFGVGAVDGSFSQNTIKAMQTFQKANALPITNTMDEATWQALTADSTLANQPVLVNYTITSQDIRIPYHPKGMQYTSVKEALGEKFHMSRGLLTELNPKIPLKSGQTITVYNPYQPNTTPITKVVANKQKNLLYAYDSNDKLIASYPTTVGSKSTPSPKGVHHVRNRVIDPTYNKDFKNKDSVLPPGPNNPVGRVWMGLSKQGYGIHGSPEPEMISRQGSHGCVRLTNWDALALFGTLQDNATVEFE